MRGRWLAPAALVAVLATAHRARGQEEEVPTTPSAGPVVDQPAIQCPRCRPGHWTEEPARMFVSLRGDLGYLYLKPRFSLGYGKPFVRWAGLDVVPYVTPTAGGAYSGLHLQLDWFELRGGARYVYAFSHQFLTPMPSYDLVELAEDTGHPSRYLDFEAEAAANVPAGPGNVIALATASAIELVPAGFYVFDETLHVVAAPPLVYRGRLGYAVRFLPEKNAQVGLIGEVIDLPDRHAQVYRAGLAATFDIDDHLQAIATVLVPVASPDALGLLGADYTELGVRYRWTTGHSHTPQEVIPAPDETDIASP